MSRLNTVLAIDTSHSYYSLAIINSNGVLSALTSITDPYLNIFRGIIPPIGGFDISSLLAFLLLNVIQNLITNLQYASLGYS